MCSLQQLLLLLSFSYLGTAQTLCGAAGFNVDPLIKPDYYKINIPEKFCNEFFPNSCTLYVSFCQEVPEELCNHNHLAPSSACITNGTTGYSLGEYSENPFEPIEDKLIASFHNGSDEHCKGDDLNTFIDFKCGPEAFWDTLQGQNYGDASANFDGLIIDFEDLCSITITVYYDQICPLAVCAARGHDINQLLGPPYWEAAVDHSQCEHFFGKREPCTLYMSFCQDITGGPSQCAGSSVCLSDGTTTYTFGQYNNYTNPFATSGYNSLEVVFNRGKNYSQCPHNASATLLSMNCADGQDWDDEGNATAHLRIVEPSPEGGCSVLISMDYSGACALPESSSSAGVGWVGLGIIIGLIVIIALYLTIGSAINIANGKSTCPEMLPQFAFWKAFFIYVIEGFYFTADLITCGWCSRTAGPAPSSNYDKL